MLVYIYNRAQGARNRQAPGLPDAREPGMGEFPTRAVAILSVCLTLNSYTLVSLFPYVGLMVQDLLGLETTNDSGEMFSVRMI